MKLAFKLLIRYEKGANAREIQRRNGRKQEVSESVIFQFRAGKRPGILRSGIIEFHEVEHLLADIFLAVLIEIFGYN